jgi:hypothetical protein
VKQGGAKREKNKNDEKRFAFDNLSSGLVLAEKYGLECFS